MSYSRRSKIVLLCLLANILVFLVLFLSQPGGDDVRQGKHSSLCKS